MILLKFYLIKLKNYKQMKYLISEKLNYKFWICCEKIVWDLNCSNFFFLNFLTWWNLNKIKDISFLLKS